MSNFGTIEEVLTFLMYSGAKEPPANEIIRVIDNGGERIWTENRIPSGVRERRISCPLVSWDEGRLFTTDHNDLLSDPCDLIGAGAEVLFFDPNDLKIGVKWFKIAPMTQRNGFFTTAPAEAKWLELHYRSISIDGKELYTPRTFAWDSKRGSVYPIIKREFAKKYLSQPAMVKSHSQEDYYHLAVIASLVEDSLPFWRVRMSSASSLELYADSRSIVDLCDLRDNPASASGRRRPILHWVERHARRVRENEAVDVCRHLRGVNRFTIGDCIVEITNPVKGGAK